MVEEPDVPGATAAGAVAATVNVSEEVDPVTVMLAVLVAGAKFESPL
jgi:hypothetical protein